MNQKIYFKGLINIPKPLWNIPHFWLCCCECCSPCHRQGAATKRFQFSLNSHTNITHCSFILLAYICVRLLRSLLRLYSSLLRSLLRLYSSLYLCRGDVSTSHTAASPFFLWLRRLLREQSRAHCLQRTHHYTHTHTTTSHTAWSCKPLGASWCCKPVGDPLSEASPPE